MPPAETGVLAKAASGALEWINLIEVPNLARALDELGEMGFHRVGLDSEGTALLDDVDGGGTGRPRARRRRARA